MKVSRIFGSLLSVSALALLAACGGGGGGGTTPPVTSPGGGGGGSTPTPVPTATPTTSPTATPTPSGSSSLTVSSTVYQAYDSTAAHSWGADNWQTNGVTESGDPGDGDLTNNVGSGQSTGNLSACALPSESQSGTYHAHAFVGIYVNGTAYAIPDAIGMYQPQGGEPITNFTCAYAIHTHADSGIVHIEDPAISGSFTSVAPPAQYNLQALFDIWGQKLDAIGVTGASGMPSIYVGSPCPNLAATCASPQKNSSGQDLVNAYSLYTGSASSLLLQHHIAIWLVYGTPPANVPQIAFGIAE